jgi:general secretion pathway protein I
MRRQRGYTLIEVIVAFALLALAMTLLLGSLSGAARQVRHADDVSRATLHAQSLLAGLGVETPLLPQRRSGDFEQGRYRWTLAVAPYADAHAPADAGAAGGPQLLQLSLAIRWGEAPSQQLQLQTLRLVTPAAGDAP